MFHSARSLVVAVPLLALAGVQLSAGAESAADRHREVVVVPKGYEAGKPIPMILGLHGYGSVPEDFSGDADYQAIADRLGIAIVAVSASVEREDGGFYWSGDIERDTAHVFELLSHVADRVTPEPGAVVAAGFSQGAQLAVELAARDPEYFAGAIALCPGANSQLAELEPTDALARRVFVVVSGERENVRGRALADADAEWLRDAGCLVVRHTYPELGHAFPPDYYGSLSMWAQFLFGTARRR